MNPIKVGFFAALAIVSAGRAHLIRFETLRTFGRHADFK